MIKKQLYKKTERIGDHTYEWLLTEKLDGSNLCFFQEIGSSYVALRNYIIKLEDLANDLECYGTNKLYKGLAEWLEDHWMDIDRQLQEGSAICGEWLGMGQLKYPDFPQFNMFAKARISTNANSFDFIIEGSYLHDYDYDPDNFQYAFADNVVPDYIGTVPVIGRLDHAPTVTELDKIYAEYAAEVNRPVEGIVITQREVPDHRSKYVRMKNGKLTPHITAEEMAAKREAGLARKAARQRR